MSDDSNSDDYPKCCSTSLCSFPSQKQSSIATITTSQSGFTTAPTKLATLHKGFTTAPTKQSTAQNGFTTAPTKQSTSHSGFTTAPNSGFTTAPHSGFTKAQNSGFTTAPTNRSTTLAFSTTHKPLLGEWSDWSAWGPCSETNSVTGYKERFRQCSNPSHTPPDSCTDQDVEFDRAYCSGGGTNACIPAEITDIQVVMGEWSLDKYVVLKCVFTGTPLPDVFWQTHTKQNVQVYHGDKAQVLIGPILEVHRGKYVCEASNLCGKAAIREYTAPDFT